MSHRGSKAASEERDRLRRKREATRRWRENAKALKNCSAANLPDCGGRIHHSFDKMLSRYYGIPMPKGKK